MTAFFTEYDLQYIQGLEQSINIEATTSQIMETLWPAAETQVTIKWTHDQSNILYSLNYSKTALYV